MKKLNLAILIAALSSAFILSACVSNPPGPAERIGRTIDQLTEDLKYADQQWGDADKDKQPTPRPRPSPATTPDDRDYDPYANDYNEDQDLPPPASPQLRF